VVLVDDALDTFISQRPAGSDANLSCTNVRLIYLLKCKAVAISPRPREVGVACAPIRTAGWGLLPIQNRPILRRLRPPLRRTNKHFVARAGE
jgi:hypothetical protein